jgi:predicted pyridoxine 5'-phosphate oxidase superfamily flavin-nucleotide-binding protein
MAVQFTEITPEQAELIQNSPLFFVATAAPDEATAGLGPINLSPKGGGPLLVIDPSRVAYLDFAGSGNETARHSIAGSPITIMVCSFDEEQAAIVRLYGRAAVQSLEASPYSAELQALHQGSGLTRMRQIVEVTVEQTITSCGYGVPALELVRERDKSDRGRKYKPQRT